MCYGCTESTKRNVFSCSSLEAQQKPSEGRRSWLLPSQSACWTVSVAELPANGAASFTSWVSMWLLAAGLCQVNTRTHTHTHTHTTSLWPRAATATGISAGRCSRAWGSSDLCHDGKYNWYLPPPPPPPPPPPQPERCEGGGVVSPPRKFQSPSN